MILSTADTTTTTDTAVGILQPWDKRTTPSRLSPPAVTYSANTLRTAGGGGVAGDTVVVPGDGGSDLMQPGREEFGDEEGGIRLMVSD